MDESLELNEAIKCLLMGLAYQTAHMDLSSDFRGNVSRQSCRWEGNGKVVEAAISEELFQSLIDDYGLREMFESWKAVAPQDRNG